MTSNREAFEMHFKRKVGSMDWHKDGRYYLDVDIHSLWEGWQAATAHNKGKLLEVSDALKSGLMCCEMLIKEGGACGNELSEEELPEIKRAIATLNEMIGDE